MRVHSNGTVGTTKPQPTYALSIPLSHRWSYGRALSHVCGRAVSWYGLCPLDRWLSPTTSNWLSLRWAQSRCTTHEGAYCWPTEPASEARNPRRGTRKYAWPSQCSGPSARMVGTEALGYWISSWVGGSEEHSLWMPRICLCWVFDHRMRGVTIDVYHWHWGVGWFRLRWGTRVSSPPVMMPPILCISCSTIELGWGYGPIESYHWMSSLRM